MARSAAGRARAGGRPALRLLLCLAAALALARPLAANASTLLFRGDAAANEAWDTSIHLPDQRHVFSTDLRTACRRVGHADADVLVYDLDGRTCERYEDARLANVFLPDFADAVLTNEGRFFSVTVGQLVNGGGLVYFDARERRVCSVFPESRPSVSSPGAQTSAEGQTISLQVVAADPEGGAVSYLASGLPPGLSIAAATGRIAGTLSYATAGSYTVTVTATDAVGLSGAAVFGWTVTNTNRPPVLAPVGDRSVAEAAPLSIVLAATDPDGDTLGYDAPGLLPEGASFDPGTRAFSWTPGYAQAGSHDVRFTVSDGALPDEETITITVTNTNRAPVLEWIGGRTCAEGESLSFVAAATDPDGDAVTCSAAGLPDGATFDLETCTFAWAPDHTQGGRHDVLFTVSDGFLPDEETVTITVTNANRAPEITPVGDLAVVEGQPLLFAVVATDPDGDGLSLSATRLPYGADFDEATGAFAWTPRLDQAGQYLVTFRAADDGTPPQFAQETVTITVTPPAVPVFSDDFSDGAAEEDWAPVSGSWAAARGVYTATNLRANNVVQVLPLDPATFPLGAGVIQGRIKLTSTASRGGPNGMLLFAYQNAAQYRWVKLTRTQILIGQTGTFGGVAGGTKKKAFKSQPLSRFAPLKVKIFPDGWVKVHKGTAPAPIVSYRFVAGGEPSIVPGGVALAASKAKTIFDDVIVWDDSALGQ